MQQTFHTRNYSIRDFEEWEQRGELLLQPKFQRRDVWTEKARSYLMDTIIRGKPIPKIYMRQEVNTKTRRVRREIVDGQQRLRTVLSFLKDGFKISKSHYPTLGGKTFSNLSTDIQGDILKYEFVVDLLQDMPDSEVYNVFARINTYSANLKPQELRNAAWFGDFKSCVYALAEEFTNFFLLNKVFNEKSVMRMAEAEFISELLIAMHEGVQAGSKIVIDNAYKKYDNEFPNRVTYEKRFREAIDTIKAIFGDDLSQSVFKAIRLFYPLFCSIYHLKHGLPKDKSQRSTPKVADYPKMKNALDNIDALLSKIAANKQKPSALTLSAEDQNFFQAYDVHWVHAENRTIVTNYITKKLVKAINS